MGGGNEKWINLHVTVTPSPSGLGHGIRNKNNYVWGLPRVIRINKVQIYSRFWSDMMCV